MKILFLILALIPYPALAADLSGPARVIDGDGLEINSQKIRLGGIDAPELRQSCFEGDATIPCGQLSKQNLERMVKGKTVDCTVSGRDKYRRFIAECFVNDQNLNAAQVRDGWALAYRYFSKVFIPEENNARLRQAGIWRYQFLAPWTWRKKKK